MCTDRRIEMAENDRVADLRLKLPRWHAEQARGQGGDAQQPARAASPLRDEGLDIVEAADRVDYLDQSVSLKVSGEQGRLREKALVDPCGSLQEVHSLQQCQLPRPRLLDATRARQINSQTTLGQV